MRSAVPGATRLLCGLLVLGVYSTAGFAQNEANQGVQNADGNPAGNVERANGTTEIMNGGNPNNVIDDELPPAADFSTNPSQNVGAPGKGPSNAASDQAADAKSAALPAAVEGFDSQIDPAYQDQGPVVKEVGGTNQFGGAPQSPGNLRNLAGGEAPETYAVEDGDTLFDICDQLLDEAGYWPKLWSFNPEIKNPHFIFPGMQLKFYPGDSETPPYLQVVTEDDVVPVDKEEGLKESELVALDPQDASHLLLEVDLPTTPEVVGRDGLDDVSLGNIFEAWGSFYDPSSLRLTIPAFIFEDEKEALGYVMGGVGGRLLVDNQDDIVVYQEQKLTPGETYTVLRRAEEVHRDEDNEFVGIRYEFVANIEIVKAIQEDSVLGQVTMDRLGVRPGDIVVPYLSVIRNIPSELTGSVRDASGNVVVGFEYPLRNIGGRGSYVFFDKSAGPLNNGEYVRIFQRMDHAVTSFIRDDLPDQKRPVAVVRIIDSTGPVATGYVVENRLEIRLGDTAGPG